MVIKKEIREYICLREKQYDELCTLSCKKNQLLLMDMLIEHAKQIERFNKKHPKFIKRYIGDKK